MYGMMGGVEKTTVYLTTEQKAALARTAELEGRSEARIIRTAIDAVTARHRITEVAPALEPPGAATIGAAPQPSTERPRWLGRADFVARVLTEQADPALRTELRELSPGTTDDEPLS